jgi:hypothetical protein
MRWESNRSLTSSSRPPSSSPAISTPHLSQTSHLTQQSQNKTIEGSIGANRHHHPFSISAGVELGYKNRYVSQSSETKNRIKRTTISFNIVF